MDVLDGFCVILVEPQNPINLGTVVRAVKNMGIHSLRLVNPASMDFDKIQISAHRSEDVVAKIETFTSLDDALADLHETYGFSARARTRAWASLEMEEAISRGIERIGEGERVGLIFGREQSGLTNDELARCRYRVHIQTSDYSSLNLAQAVLLACYSAFRQTQHGVASGLTHDDNHLCKSRPATQDEQTRLLRRIHETLIEIGFYKAPTKSTAMHRIHNIFNRAQLHDDEIRLLMGIFSEIGNYARLVDRGIVPERIRPVDKFLDDPAAKSDPQQES